MVYCLGFLYWSDSTLLFEISWCDNNCVDESLYDTKRYAGNTVNV